MAAESTTKEQEIQNVLKEYPLTYPIAVALVLVALGILIGAALFGQGGMFANDNGYGANVYTSVISTIVTVGFIDRLNRRREQQQALKNFQNQLVLNAGSLANEIAKDAAHQLKKRGMLKGESGLLKGADLFEANLAGANLYKANLAGVNLGFANLEGVYLNWANMEWGKFDWANLERAALSWTNLEGGNLEHANLKGAVLYEANLTASDLEGAELQEATLMKSNLQRANLYGAKLQAANLRDANLQGALLKSVEFDENTRLPDGTQWTPDTDLTKFGAIVE